MTAVPALAALAALAALIDWIASRGLLRAATAARGAGLSHETLLSLQSAASVVRNIAAIAGLVALYICLSGWIRERKGVPLMLRVTVAGFAGILLPTLFLATVLPAQRTSPLIVLFSTITTHVLALTVTVVSLNWAKSRSIKIAATLVAVASFFSFGSVSLLIVGELTLWETAHPLGMAMRRTGEVSYLVALLLLPLIARPWKTRRGQIGLVLGGALGIGIAIAITQAKRSFEPEIFGPLFYGATHLELLLKPAPLAYIVWMMASVALAVGAIASAEKAPGPLGAWTGSAAQAGLASILLLAAGFAPTTPSTLLMWCLGALLISRAAVGSAFADDNASIRDVHVS